jgi:tetrapyrrole methylase family protein/MazG family protein
MMSDQNDTLKSLLAVMRKLRSPEGCPWDREQSSDSIKLHLIEEAYEVVDAIERKNTSALKEELGDVLLQLIFHAQINEEQELFNFYDVISALQEKLIRRHPHVFSSGDLETSDEVLKQWDEVKRQEKEGNTVLSAVESVPRNMPAMLRATQIQKRVSRIGFDWDSIEQVLAKIDEEMQEVRKALDSADQDAIYEELGDVLFSVVNATRYLGFQAEEVLKDNIDKFCFRFKCVEEMASQQGKSLEEASPEELNHWWISIKNREK